MTGIAIHWPMAGGALVLLLLPIGLFHGARTRHRALSSDWSGYWGRTLGHGFHAIDFGRAMLGAWYLVDGLLPAADATGIAVHAPLLAQSAVLAIGTTLQTFVCKERHAACAPFAYTAGVATGFLPITVGWFAVTLAIVFTFGVRAPALFFPALSAAVAGVSLLMAGLDPVPAHLAAAAAAGLPWLLTLLFPRELTVACLARTASSERIAAGDVRK
ncbi:MAG: hypothetical protein JNL39_03885 [Opitutaceae bacterium]|nr:hypothetical protein [Opitutaceae bacterium]